ncbi:MAG: zinc-ribbon domain-containing protein [Polyangiaceae bacterium]|nr:zinc-ribbon domain-containing protein [Polyangiaceae bacterium]MCW5789331.1 zinc-ribbon domain-containing protein [Polyangiaceae bacterium]
MDVSCSRCGTEYEFDDALVSDRGTTVKCTHCGHQFKVHPAGGGLGPERWVVRTTAGRELVYTSLRDLQKGISQRQIGPEDLLSRGGSPPRPLSSIAELEPFFKRIASVPPPGGKRSTSSGLGTPPAGSPSVPPAAPASMPPAAPAPPAASSAPRASQSSPPPKPKKPPIPGKRVGSPTFEIEPEPPTIPNNPIPRLDAAEALSPPTSSLSEPQRLSYPEQHLKLPRDVKIRDSVDHTPTPADVTYGDGVDSSRVAGVAPYARRQTSRWIVGVVLVGGLVLAAVTIGRDYLTQSASSRSGTRAEDARVLTFVNAGDRALADGDFEGAKEQYDKASALAEQDARVMVAQARLEAARADIVWLKLRLLDPKADEVIQTTHQELAGRVRRALATAAAAEAVAPEDASVIRARVDALRLQGEIQKARAHVAPIAGTVGQAETAYVIAALDLAEKEPSWSSVIERLRVAVAAETGPGRASAALVYALTRSGALPAAKQELEKIAAAVRPHPLVNQLREFVRRHEQAADAGAADEPLTMDPSKLPVISEGPIAGSPTAVSGDLPAGDFRTLLTQANAALRAGELDKAERLYRGVLAKQPGNTEALAGLGDVSARRKDPAAAAQAYDQVLEQNPNYLPALLGKADQSWAAGDYAAAVRLYQRVLESAGPGTDYGQRAAARLAEHRRMGSAKDAGAAPVDTSEPAPKPTPAPDDTPEIDTTDLPE